MALELVWPRPRGDAGVPGQCRMPGRHGTCSPTKLYLKVSLCRPTAPGLPIWGTRDFGTSPIFGQLSDKPLLACIYLVGVSERKAQWRIGTLMRRGSGFLLCWRRRSRSTPEVAAAPSIILDKGNLTYLKKIDGSQHPGSISLNYFAQRPFACYSANVCLYLARLLSLGWRYPLLEDPS